MAALSEGSVGNALSWSVSTVEFDEAVEGPTVLLNFELGTRVSQPQITRACTLCALPLPRTIDIWTSSSTSTTCR